MDVDDLAALMGKTKEDVEEMLKTDDVIELKLTERKKRSEEDKYEIKSI